MAGSGNTKKGVKSTLDPHEAALEGNPLRVGICTLYELEERLKAFRIMNRISLKKRFMMSREKIVAESGEVLLSKAEDIDLKIVKKLRSDHHGSMLLNIYQPDEGIVVVSDSTAVDGIRLTNSIMREINQLSKKKYEGFIDHVDSLFGFMTLFRTILFPRLILIGYVHPGRLNAERNNIRRIRKIDRYLRIVEVLHSRYKQFPYFQDVRTITIHEDQKQNTFQDAVIREYIKPYFIEE